MVFRGGVCLTCRGECCAELCGLDALLNAWSRGGVGGKPFNPFVLRHVVTGVLIVEGDRLVAETLRRIWVRRTLVGMVGLRTTSALAVSSAAWARLETSIAGV
jgi:hypothetical protein